MGFEDVFDLDLEVGPGAAFAFGFYLDVEDVGGGGFLSRKGNYGQLFRDGYWYIIMLMRLNSNRLKSEVC